MARALRPGGRLAVSAFSAYFQVRYLEDARHASTPTPGVNHERTEVRDEAGAAAEVDLWTTCFTPRELRLLAAGAGLDGRAPLVGHARRLRRATPPTIDTPELLLVARRP